MMPAMEQVLLTTIIMLSMLHILKAQKNVISIMETENYEYAQLQLNIISKGDKGYGKAPERIDEIQLLQELKNCINKYIHE